MSLHPDRFFPADRDTRGIARSLYAHVKDLPIISPHGHTNPAWFAENAPFPDPAQLLIVPDHYILRMLISQGIRLEDMGVAPNDGGAYETDGKAIWRRFAENFHLFRATPSRMWLEHTLVSLFGVADRLSPATADGIYDRIAEHLQSPDYRPRALFERFNIEAIATTEGALDPLTHHASLKTSGWTGRVVTAYRPDDIVNASVPGFSDRIAKLGELTGENTRTWDGYLAAHRARRAHFIAHGATSSDHGHPSARTADLPRAEAMALYAKVLSGAATPEEQDLFRGQMLTEMARMSLDDGLVLQIHPGSFRNHSPALFNRFGADKGTDIPVRTDYVHMLKPLLDAVGMERDLTIVLFTLDETVYTRELAPLAGVYPALRLGPPWWFHDSPEGMLRFRRAATETAGFYNTVGFNDDTRAFPSIPARHDMARRIDCAYLAELVATHRLSEEEAAEVAEDLTYRLVKKAYKL